MAKMQDVYANKFYGTVTESAANTLTFSEISTNINVFDKVGWVLARLEWYLTPANIALITGDADSIQLALCSSNTLSSLGLSDPAVIDLIEITDIHVGTAGDSKFVQIPITHDFSSLAGGGIIIAPRPLHVAVKGTSLASAVTAAVRGYFTQLELGAAEYLELIDFYRIVS